VPKNVEVKIKCYFLDFKVLKKSAKLSGSGIVQHSVFLFHRKVLNKSAKLFGSGIYTEFGILILSRISAEIL
jgi:hypothetical protein